MVAGEHAEASGVDRQRLVQPELGREIGHARVRPGVDAPHPGALPLQVAVEVLHGEPVQGYGPRVLRGPFQVLRLLQEADRVVLRALPQGRVEPREELLRLGTPRPEDVPRQLRQPAQSLRYSLPHGKALSM